ncbi:MAG: mercury resistance protein [Candidatus Rokubacteria bacterium]|nr:mercury resistance protein [Candidatus Rokubacteria bacterium]
MTTPGPPCSGSGSPRSLKGYLLLGVAFVTCPCHLPLLLAVLAGTGLAGALSQYFGLAFVALSVIFAVSLFWGLKALKGGQQGRP